MSSLRSEKNGTDRPGCRSPQSRFLHRPTPKRLSVPPAVAQRRRCRSSNVVDAIGGFGDDLTPERFQQAQVVNGELVGAWLRQRVDVIAHGPFFQRQEDEALLHAVPDGIEPRRVQLLATYEAALERVADDPARDLSKVPGLLRLTYDRVESLLPTI